MWYSQMSTHLGTDQTRHCVTLVILWEPVFKCIMEVVGEASFRASVPQSDSFVELLPYQRNWKVQKLKAVTRLNTCYESSDTIAERLAAFCCWKGGCRVETPIMSVLNYKLSKEGRLWRLEGFFLFSLGGGVYLKSSFYQFDVWTTRLFASDSCSISTGNED